MYEFYEDIYYFYFFNDEENVEEARTEFRNRTANFNVVSYQFYSLKNVLILHHYPGELRSKSDPLIEKIMSKFD